MGHLGTSVISHKGWIAQGAEHPEYQVEGLLQAGCGSFDVTTVASPEGCRGLTTELSLANSIPAESGAHCRASPRLYQVLWMPFNES